MRSSFRLLFFAILLLSFNKSYSQEADPNNGLKHWMTPEEAAKRDQIGRAFVETDPPQGVIRNVEEFGPSEAVLIRYPFGIPMSLIKEMAKKDKVITIVASSAQQTTVNSQYQSNGVNTANCSYLIANTDSYWTRDYGPWFVTYGDLQTGIVDFPYNRPRPNDDEIPKKVAQLLGIEWFGMNVIHTGGNYMTDGMHQSSSTTLVWEENPSQTHEQVAQKMHDYLGIDNYMVQEDPNGTYIDHIDCWGKFLGPDKILIRKVPVSHPQYDEIEATAAFYAAQISSYGAPYRVFRVNTPNNEPYTNSYILNNKVFVPFMGTSNDAGALLAYQQAMPGYQITGFLALPSAAWESTDALHCRTHEIADRGMLYISHMPLHGSLPAQDHFDINADITAYSQQPIYSDSVWLIYKVNSSPYDTLAMANTSANHYTASIPGQMEGSTIAYYIHAKDASGRSASHPFIGAPDPHVFEIAVSNPPALVVYPDTLYFSTVDDILYGKTAYLKNFTSQSIAINELNNTGTQLPAWYIDPWNLELPYVQSSGENLELQVKIAIPVAKTEWVCDSMVIQTEYDTYNVVICADPYLLSGMQQNDPEQVVKVYPNPAGEVAHFTFTVKEPSEVQLDITTINGQLIRSLASSLVTSGNHTIEWHLDDMKSANIPAGLYFYRLSVGPKVYTGKISVVR